MKKCMRSIDLFRSMTLTVALASPLMAAAQSAGQPYPTRAVRMVVPYAAGGELDAMARTLAQRLHEKWGQPVIVENRPGAGSIIGTDAVAKAAPDGYTLLFTSFGFVTTQLGPKLPYDPAGFQPVALVATSPLLMFVHPQFPPKTLKEVVEYAKSRPKELSFGSAGIGSSPHLAAELFGVASGAEITHIAYKGIAPAVLDLYGGHIKAVFGAPSLLNDVQAGRLRVLGVANQTRLIAAPDVPTLTELGLPAVNAASWYGVLMQGKVPADLRELISRDVVAAVQSPAMRAHVLQGKFEPSSLAGAQFGKFLQDELVKWGRVIRERNIKLD